MLASLAKHSLIDLRVKATGDVDVDAHHTVEDVAIVLGDALREALGDKRGICRFGDATVPLDEALVQAVVDVAGRPYVVHTGEPEGQAYVVIGGNYVGSLTRHVWESFAGRAGIALHVRVLSGRDPHHIVEAQFKAVARALRAAVARDPRVERRTQREGQPLHVSVPWQSAPGARGLLLVSGEPGPVVGLGAPRAGGRARSSRSAAGPRSAAGRARQPGRAALRRRRRRAGRPAGATAAPARASGFFEVGDRAVVTVPPRGLARRPALVGVGARGRGRPHCPGSTRRAPPTWSPPPAAPRTRAEVGQVFATTAAARPARCSSDLLRVLGLPGPRPRRGAADGQPARRGRRARRPSAVAAVRRTASPRRPVTAPSWRRT